jgi:capsid protein
MTNLGAGAGKPDNQLQYGYGQGQSDGGYDAVRNRQRRREVAINLKSEDWVLRPWDRDRMVSHTRVLRRNASIVAWAIRKHLDYCATFSFQCRTGNKEVDKDIEGFMEWWSKPLNFDVSGRFSLKQMIRMAEGLAVTDGDCFLMKLNDGRIQLIEGDRVRTPTDLGAYKGNLAPNGSLIDSDTFVHGVQANNSGKHISYAICDRTGNLNAFVLKKVVKAYNCYQHAYRDRYDQHRGITPLASAINTFCDIYEASEYALAKMKLQQLFALKMTRAADTQDNTAVDPYSFDFGSGPQVIDLDHGDDASFMESASPSSEFQSFIEKGVAFALKALDIPYSFFDESHTNYSGARQALLQYEQSCTEKRERIQNLLNNMTAWRIGLAIADGEIVLPTGWTISDLKWDYIPAALPWIDPQKEAMAQQILLANRLTTRSIICKEQGQDFFDIVDGLAAEEAYMKSKGVAVDPTAVASAVDAVTKSQQQQQDDGNAPADAEDGGVNENGNAYGPNGEEPTGADVEEGYKVGGVS